MRWSRALVAALFILVIAACSSPAADDPDGNPDGGGSSNPPPASQAAASQDDGGGDDDGDDDDGGTAGDVEEVFNALVPPNSTETSKTTMGGAITASYSSADSVESLVGFYESAIPGTGMEVFSTSTAQGSTSWLFGEEAGSTFGGSVTVAPDTNAGGASQVVVIVTGE